MPTAVPASSWRLADGYHSEARRTLILAAFDLVFQAEFRAKKTPPVSGWRSNYAHLTEANLQAPRHNSVKSHSPPDSIHSATKTLTFGTLSSNARSGIITSEATTNENA